MPGLCGVASPSFDANSFLKAFRRVNTLPGILTDEIHCAQNGFLGVSFVRPEISAPTTVGRVPGSDAVLLLEGEIFNGAALSNLPSNYRLGSLASALLSQYLERGAGFIADVDGEFNLVIFEPRHRRLSIFNDHIGSYPLYTWHCNSGFLFGSEKKYVLAAAGDRQVLDPVGLLQPFVHRHNIERRTFLNDVYRLLPATHLTFERNEVRCLCYAGELGGRQLPRAARDVLDGWRSELQTATAKRLSGKSRLVISLSGGLDSRAVACAIDRRQRPILARTMGLRGTNEVEIARAIAKSLYFEHNFEDRSDCVLSDMVRKIVWRTDGETQFLDGLSILSHRRNKSAADHMIGGWLGDVSSGAHLRPFMLTGRDRKTLPDKVFNWYVAYSGADYRRVFEPNFLRQYLPAVRQEFVESYARYSDYPPALAHELWDLRNRQTRMTISSMPVDSHLFGKVRPFFDRSYLNYVMSLPVKYKLGQNLYKSLIYSLGPEIRRIPNGNDNVRLHAWPMANAAAFAARKASDATRTRAARLTSRWGVGRSKQTPLTYSQQIRSDAGFRQIISDFVESDLCDDTVFSRTGIRAVLREHYESNADNSVLIGILATWLVALQYFVCRKSIECPTGSESYG